jgi:hypothetical protein
MGTWVSVGVNQNSNRIVEYKLRCVTIRRTDNTLAKRRRMDNTMAKRRKKDIHHNGQKKDRQHNGHENID